MERRLPSWQVLCHIIHTVHLALVHQGAAVTFCFLLARWNAEDATEKHLVSSPLTIVEPKMLKMLMKDATHAARVTSRIAVIGQSNHWFDNWSRLITEACDGHTNYSKQLRHLVKLSVTFGLFRICLVCMEGSRLFPTNTI